MLPLGHCSVGTTGLSTSFRFSTHGRNLYIVSYNRLRYSEPADNILPHKLVDILVFNGGEGFSFYPFAKIVGGNQQ